MAVYTNMAWPDDPYGTGQLWRKEPPLLASVAVVCPDDGISAVPVSYAVTYLRLHRTRSVDATAGLPFGFRAAGATDIGARTQMVALFDLDALRARRLSKIVTGYRLTDDLYALQTAGGETAGRGIQALAADWGHGRAGTGMAVLVDVADELTEDEDLADAAAAARVDTATAQRAFQPQHTVADRSQMSGQAEEWLAACATERALIAGLVTSRRLSRYTWDGALDVGAVLAANVWDCFPSQDFSPHEHLA